MSGRPGQDEPERVYVVPRAVLPDAANWYGMRVDGLEAFEVGGGARGPI